MGADDISFFQDDKVAVNSVISDPTGVPADRNLMSNDKDSVEKSDTSLSNDSDAIFDEPVPRDKSCGLFRCPLNNFVFHVP